jgi:peptidoglycan-associated lipoprotein
MRKNYRYLLAAALALVLAGCGSSVKLNNPPEQAASAATGTQDTGQSTVKQVTTDDNAGNNLAGPPGVDQIVYFDFDSFVVKPEYQPVVEAQARYLRADPKRHVVLEGNTDPRGSREYNLALGQKRAEAVRQALTILGVSDAQMEAISYGEEKPAAQGNTEEAYAKDRRVEFSYR